MKGGCAVAFSKLKALSHTHHNETFIAEDSTISSTVILKLKVLPAIMYEAIKLVQKGFSTRGGCMGIASCSAVLHEG